MCKREYTALSQIPIRGFSTNIEKIVIRILIGQWRPLFLGCWRKTGFLFYIFFAPPKKLFQQIKKVKKKVIFFFKASPPPPSPLSVTAIKKIYIYFFLRLPLEGGDFTQPPFLLDMSNYPLRIFFLFFFLSKMKHFFWIVWCIPFRYIPYSVISFWISIVSLSFI